MPNATKTTYPDALFCGNGGCDYMPEGYTLECIEDFYPVWSAEPGSVPFTLSGYDTGELVLCPKHLSQHPPAVTFGLDRGAKGIVCDECRTVYAQIVLIPDFLKERITCIPPYVHDKIITPAINLS